MRHDDRHVGKIDRDIVDMHRIRILEPHVVAAAHARSDAGLSGVEERRLAGLLDRLVKRIGEAVVRVEPLHGGMKLESLHTELIDEAACFTRADFAFVRIDRSERNQDIAVLGSELSDFLVLVTAIAGLALSIDWKDDGSDILLPEMRGRLLHGRRMLPRRAEIFR